MEVSVAARPDASVVELGVALRLVVQLVALKARVPGPDPGPAAAEHALANVEPVRSVHICQELVGLVERTLAWVGDQHDMAAFHKSLQVRASGVSPAFHGSARLRRLDPDQPDASFASVRQ